jgi:NAD(P)-dependent dehydrogenase (short-subunit alcohol dehydrogenase family)
LIVLTGASGGIGQELVECLQERHEVLGTYNSSPPANPVNEKVYYEKLDITDAQEVNEFVEKWRQKLSSITIVHMAVCNIDGLVARYSEEDWDRVMKVNVQGDFLLTQALLPFMVEQNWGRIIHISSLAGVRGEKGTAAYSASKTSIAAMARVMAQEYARFNITSNTLILGYFETGLYSKLSANHRNEILTQIPAQSLGEVYNIANAVNFLIESGYVTGAEINIDGGMNTL